RGASSWNPRRELRAERQPRVQGMGVAQVRARRTYSASFTRTAELAALRAPVDAQLAAKTRGRKHGHGERAHRGMVLRVGCAEGFADAIPCASAEVPRPLLRDLKAWRDEQCRQGSRSHLGRGACRPGGRGPKQRAD